MSVSVVEEQKTNATDTLECDSARAQTERCVKLLLFHLDCVIMNLLLLLLFVQYVITWLTLVVCTAENGFVSCEWCRCAAMTIITAVAEGH